jgi:hypothetical protein
VLGCQIEPEDKWPVVVGYETPAGITVTLKTVEVIGAVIEVPDFTFEVTSQVRTYNANQDFTITLFLTDVAEIYTPYVGGLPMASQAVSHPSDLQCTSDHVHGTYLSGTAPQGIVELVTSPEAIPVPGSVADWVHYYKNEENKVVLLSITQQYAYHFRYIVEDAEGRSDSFTFTWTVDIKID